ncbi:hypothetical protein [Bacillus sp. V5-8f]|uniref:hypothetical protein n=1 Tax=Bacillus sp. V5-8f TaxID=2053044 RepID=UPI000C771BE2|nr:hypothetical protein [Bacillus sp. V5-8f]PLT34227.1 hypothetical protein CUU64_08325 [Bacillus sp. V5-8f]
MQPLHFIPSMQNRTPLQQPEKLQAGQIIHGKINRIYPNQTAEVQIGNQKFMASLDASLKADERYWLQVQPGGGRLHLKVLHGLEREAGGGIKGTVLQLLDHLVVPQSKESIELANYLLKNQLPVTRDTFIMSLGWLKATDNLGGTLNSIKTMHTMNLPFLDDVFHALQALEKDGTLHDAAKNLLTQISEHGSDTETMQNVKNLLEKIMLPKQVHFPSYTMDKLLSSWLSMESSPDIQKSAFSILQKAGFFPVDSSEAGIIEKLTTVFGRDTNQSPPSIKTGLSLIMHYQNAKKSGNESEGEILELFNRLLKNPGDVKDAPIQAILAKAQNLQLSERSVNVSFNQPQVLQGDQTREQIKQLLHALLEPGSDSGEVNRQYITAEQIFSAVGGGKENLQQSYTNLVKLIASETEAGPKFSQLDNMESQFLRTTLSAGDKPVDFARGQAVAGFLKEMAKLLGVNLEHVLANSGRMDTLIPEGQLESLKPLLMKVLAQNQQTPIKEAAEQILNRITAQQLLSQESGPLQNIFMQIPMADSRIQTDLTLQWSGRKRNDGTIDPDYCRVLFYLDLAQMKQTVIDLQIQNKVIKVKVINDNHEILENLSGPLLKTLKTNLGHLDYKLSSVVFESESIMETKRSGMVAAKGLSIQAGSKQYSGVDIRI